MEGFHSLITMGLRCMLGGLWQVPHLEELPAYKEEAISGRLYPIPTQFSSCWLQAACAQKPVGSTLTGEILAGGSGVSLGGLGNSLASCHSPACPLVDGWNGWQENWSSGLSEAVCSPRAAGSGLEWGWWGWGLEFGCV